MISGWDHWVGIPRDTFIYPITVLIQKAFPKDAVAIVRYLNEESGNHVYSTSLCEQEKLDQNSKWLNEGIDWYGDAFALISEQQIWMPYSKEYKKSNNKQIASI